MQQQNDRSRHRQNPSINSLASIGSVVEPLTPPDLGEQFVTSRAQSSNSAGSNAHSSSTTPLSGLSSNLGGNTFRSRFRSLPLVDELEYKFNQFNINSLQNLSQSSIPTPNQSNSSSGNSIPQVLLQAPLNLYVPPQQHSTKCGSRKKTSQLQHDIEPRRLNNQHHHHRSSLPSIQQQNTIKKDFGNMTVSNFKNFDELNLIPIENLDILKLSVDQYGCRYLQRKLESDNSIRDVVFNKVFNNLIDLIVDPFGNYLIQKLIDYLSTYQKDLLIEKTHTYMFVIAINQYGTRSLQKIIDRVDSHYQMDLIIKGLQLNDRAAGIEDNNMVKLIKDLNGNHVVQKCIFKFPPEKFQFIIDSICLNDNIVRIATHKHGCCVLQKLLNSANFDQLMKISKILLIYLRELIDDQFGNYIIQFVFELNFLREPSDLDFLIVEFFSKVYPNLVQLSCLKYSSNVIEKYIKILKVKMNYEYLNEIIKLINVNFEVLIKDKFGNYVIQTMIDQFYDVQELNLEMNVLVNTVKNYLPVIKAAPYARKIQLKIQQLETSYTHELPVSMCSIPPSCPQNFIEPQSFYVSGDFSQHHHNEFSSKYGPPPHFNSYFTTDVSQYSRADNIDVCSTKMKYQPNYLNANYNPI